jgi:serine/threonine protein kinase
LFPAEKDILMQARHPFVVRLKYSFQNESRIYMVMDFCQGGELFLKLKRAGKFSEDTVRFYAAEVILALHYLHEKLGIIHRLVAFSLLHSNLFHRDLKPENILLCADGHIKVTDFGLSKGISSIFIDP